MRERSRELSAQRREIGALPPIKNPKRRTAAKRSFRLFCETYFPKKFKLKWAKFHLKIIAAVEDRVKNGGRLIIVVPRGSGKTAIMVAAALWAVFYGYRKFIMVVAASKTDAEDLLEGIKAAVSENLLILEDFPEIVYPFWKLGGSALLARGQTYLRKATKIKWSSREIVIPAIPGSPASGARAFCVGLRGKIRGKFKDMPDGSTQRPDMVLIDDPQTEGTAVSPTQTGRLKEIIDKAIGGLAGPGEELAEFMMGTVIREGDLVDDYAANPMWNGIRFSALESMPSNMDLWYEYRDLRRESEAKANAFYRKNRKEMDRGAVASWPENFVKGKELSAIQSEMNRWCDDEVSFWSERQGKPMRADSELALVPVDEIVKRLNGFERGTVPIEAQRLAAFIDIHGDILYWCVVAWADDFTGYVIDYGVYPDQAYGRNYFTKSDKSLRTLKKQFPGTKTDAAILAGLNELIRQILDREFEIEEETEDGIANTVSVERLLIDSGYKQEIVTRSIIASGAKTTAKPSKGRGIKAGHKPMSEWQKHGSDTPGRYWVETRPRGWAVRLVTIDTNYWKCQVHDALSLKVGDRGGLSLWGHDRQRHRMFAEHLNAEGVMLVKAGEREVNEWLCMPGRDNHLFDCIVGCFVAASHIGITPKEFETPKKSRRI